MGQYFNYLVQSEKHFSGVNLGGGDGSKLLEATSHFDKGALAILEITLNAPSKVVFCGDYWDGFLERTDNKELSEKILKNRSFLENQSYIPRSSLSGEVESIRNNFLVNNLDNTEKFFSRLGLDLNNTYVLNHTRKEKIKIVDPRENFKRQKEENISIENPIPILLAVGNGEGLGDFIDRYGANKPELAGIWAFDVIETTINLSEENDYKDMTNEYTFETK